MTKITQPDSGAAVGAAPSDPLLTAAQDRSIPVTLIERPSNIRAEGPDATLPDLAASIARDGLLHPVVVFRKPGKAERYVIAAGFRRLRAHELNKAKQIPARIIPAERYSPAALQSLMAVENLDRLNLSPIEEAAACVALQERLDEEHQRSGAASETRPDDDFISAIADRIGRPPRWVEGRISLLRLSEKNGAALAAGTILLGHALELAKLVDDKVQDEVAKMIWWSEDGTRCRTSAAEVRHAVEAKMTSLHGVPWKLDAAFAGCPACDGCPDNTDNAPPILFAGADDAAPKQARCLKASCYKKKAAAAQRETTRAVQVLVKGKDTGAAAVRDTAKPFVKPATVARKAKAALEAKQPVKTPKAGKPAKQTQSADQQRWRAQDKARRHAAKRDTEITAMIVAAIGDATKEPLKYVALGLLMQTRSWDLLDVRRAGGQRGKRRATAATKRAGDVLTHAVKAIRDMKPGDTTILTNLAHTLLKELDKKQTTPAAALYAAGDRWHTDLRSEQGEILATALGITELPEAKTADDFMPKPKAGDGKKTTKKKVTRRKKTSRRKPTRRKVTTKKKTTKTS